MTLILAIVWSIALIIDIVSESLGNKPNWMHVIIPTFILVMNYWVEVFA